MFSLEVFLWLWSCRRSSSAMFSCWPTIRLPCDVDNNVWGKLKMHTRVELFYLPSVAQCSEFLYTVSIQRQRYNYLRPHLTLDELQCIFDRTFIRIVIDQANHVIISPTGSIVSHSIEGKGISKSVYFSAVSNYFCMSPKQSKKITA